MKGPPEFLWFYGYEGAAGVLWFSGSEGLLGLSGFPDLKGLPGFYGFPDLKELPGLPKRQRTISIGFALPYGGDGSWQNLKHLDMDAAGETW